MAAPRGEAWFVIPADGGEEQWYRTPFQAHMELDKLGVEGDIEHWSERTQRRELSAHRNADGTWTVPDKTSEPMNVRKALDELAYGDLTYDDLKAQFRAATFTVPQLSDDPAERWQQAEELPLDDDVPSLLASATFARTITRKQEDELLRIYEQR
ncbi:MAG TPA: hypothetical protein VH496_06585, partial [Mycobacterium sp.]